MKDDDRAARKAASKRATISKRQVDNSNNKPAVVKVCGAKKRNVKETCRQTAGFRTQHPGYGNCWMHGGNSPTGIAKAEKEMVMERMAAESQVYGIHRDIGPHQALLEEVQRTAGHVTWLEQKIRSMDEKDLTQYTGKDGMKESEWIKMYQEERKMLVNVCNTAIRAGIAERQVRIVEEQGRLIAAMLLKFINDQTLDLTPEQRLYAPKLARNLLLEVSHGELEAPQQQIIGEEIIDVESEELSR